MLTRVFGFLTAIAAIEGCALLAYGIFDSIQAIRIGATGPAEVSNPAAITLQIVIFAVFGIGLLLIARGWLKRSRWVRGPFVLAQVIALVVGVPLVQASGSIERGVGIVVVLLAVSGLILTFTRPVMDVFASRD